MRPIRTIVLNALGLEIRSARMVTPGGSHHTGAVELDRAEQRLSVTFPDDLPAGPGYRLHLVFAGVLDEGLRGFYRSTFAATTASTRSSPPPSSSPPTPGGRFPAGTNRTSRLLSPLPSSSTRS